MIDDVVGADVPQPAYEPTAIDQSAVPIRSDNAFGRLGIFNDVVVQRHDPAGAWILFGGDLEARGPVLPTPGRARW